MAAKTKAVKRARKGWSGGLVPVRRTTRPMLGLELTSSLEQRIVATVDGLLRVARIAMPDDYFATDSRVRRGQKLLAMFGRRPVR
jgi:hypothetical protein